MKKSQDDNREKLEFIYILLQKKIDNVDAAYTALGTKSGILFGFTSATIAFYLNLLFQQKLLSNAQLWVLELRWSSVASLLLTLIYLCVAIKMRGFDDSPHQDIILGKEVLFSKGKPLYSGKKPIDAKYLELKAQVIFDMKGAYNRNKSILESATVWYKFSMGLLLGSVCLMIMSVILK